MHDTRDLQVARLPKLRISSQWIEAILILWLGAVSTFYVFFNFHSPVRSVYTLVFALLCPGLAWVRVIPLRGHFSALALAVALSIALNLFVSAALFIVGWWRPMFLALILFALTLDGLGVQLLRAIPKRRVVNFRVGWSRQIPLESNL